MFHRGTKVKSRRKGNAYNAFISQKAYEVNSGMLFLLLVLAIAEQNQELLSEKL
jgi:hypothetical protein